MNNTIRFVEFSKPFIDALKDVFSTMVFTEITAHSPKIKTDDNVEGDISSIIGMNGTYEIDGNKNEFTGLVALTWTNDVYLKIASKMLMEEYTKFTPEIEDVGAEIANIVMGNAKKALSQSGFKIGMASPSTIRGKELKRKYLKSSILIETQISSEIGNFTIEICFKED